MRALADLAKRFPDDVNALRLDLEALDQEGPIAEADRIAARIKTLDPDSELDLDRALARHDWKGAITELERIQKRRPDRKDIAARLADVLAREGDPSAAVAQLEKALEQGSAGRARRVFSALADAPFAKGHAGALRKALADALAEGARRRTTSAERDRSPRGGHLARAVASRREEADPRLRGLGEEGASHGGDGRARPRLLGALGSPRTRLERHAARARDPPAHPGAGGDRPRERAAAPHRDHPAPARPQARRHAARARAGRGEADGHDAAPPRWGDYIEDRAHHARSRATARRGSGTAGRTWVLPRGRQGVLAGASSSSSRRRTRKLDIEARGSVPTRPPSATSGRSSASAAGSSRDSPPAPEEPESAHSAGSTCRACVSGGASTLRGHGRALRGSRAVDTSPLDPRVRARAADMVKGLGEAQRDERARAPSMAGSSITSRRGPKRTAGASSSERAVRGRARSCT